METWDTGFDIAQPLSTSEAAAFHALGFRFVGRYYGQNHAKVLSRNEAARLNAVGLAIVSVYEDGPTNAGYFHAVRGAEDGIRAVQQAHVCQQPEATPIYGAVDYDAAASDTEAITSYFTAFHAKVKDAGFAVGVYGSGRVCNLLLDSGLVSHTWLSQSEGWAGYRSFLAGSRWNIRQGPETKRLGLDIDLDTTRGNGGGWIQK